MVLLYIINDSVTCDNVFIIDGLNKIRYVHTTIVNMAYSGANIFIVQIGIIAVFSFATIGILT